MESAQALQPFTAETHLWARSRPLPQGGEGVRFAFETHYVGDIRAGRTTILDTYLLKSLDSFDFSALNGGVRLVVIPCHTSRFCVWKVYRDDCMDKACEAAHGTGGQGLKYKLPVAVAIKDSSLAKSMRATMEKYAPNQEGKDWFLEHTVIEDDSD